MQCSEWAPVWARVRDHGQPISPRDVPELAHVRDMGAPTTPAHAHRVKLAGRQPLTVRASPPSRVNDAARLSFNQRAAMGRATLAAIGMTPMERIYR